MKRVSFRIAVCLLLFLLFSPPGFTQAQPVEVKPLLLGQAMPDFTLPALQGGEVTLAKLKGKNVVILFPRGYAAEGRWCTICHYQVASLVELEKKDRLRKKYNTEILLVLPYTLEQIEAWSDAFPEQLQKIKEWKNPAEPDKLDDAKRQRQARARQLFPKEILWSQEEAAIPFPVLIDVERRLSRSLGLFSTEWGGSKVDQNMPSVYILDKEGLLRFKYIGQNTADRPSAEYVEEMLALIARK